MAKLDDLLATDEEPPARRSLDDLLATDEPVAAKGSRARVPTAEDMAALDAYNNQKPQAWYDRAAMGANDMLLGAGQLMQHVLPDAALNVGRKVTDPLVNAAMGGKPVDSSDTTTADFDAGMRQREKSYQAARADAGKDGIDLFRLGGTLANPMSWLSPSSGAGAGTWNAIKTGAQQGAFQALLQPVTDPGSYLFDKSMQTAVGGVMGGTIAGALSLLQPALSRGAGVVRKALGGADDAAEAAAAGKVVDDTLKAAEVEPAKMDPKLYSAIRNEVDDALKLGVDPDPKVIARRADAEALPVPITLLRGQATRDPMLYSWEVNTAKLRGAGEPLTERITQQNQQLIQNLNELGAARAPTTFDASQKIISHLEGVDAQMKGQVDAAYKLVRDSAGRPALMDQTAFQQRAREALEYGQLTEYVPEAIKKQYNALAMGHLPLTVDTAQALDRVWSAEQRAATGSAKMAIGELRKALNDAPVTDQLGEESMQAYKAARQLAAQRFGLMEANPAYKAVVDGVEPDKFFQKYIQGANVSELGGLKKLVGPENTALLQDTFTGNLKKIALNRASDENGIFSQSAYNKVLQDPVQGPRIRELFSDAPDRLGQLYRLGRVAEDVQAFPKGHSVNTSNTAPTAANMIRDVAKSETVESLWNLIPGARTIRGVKGQHEMRKAVDEALKPGVTKEALKKAAPSPQVRELSSLLSRGGATYAVRDEEE